MRHLLVALASLALLTAMAAPAAASCPLPNVFVDVTPIYAGQTIEAGYAEITNDGCDLIITAFATNGWLFQEAHAYVGNTPTPVKGGGNPAPGRFPYALNFNSPVPDFEIRVPLSSLVPGGQFCTPQTVWIALHVVVGNGGSGKNATETGWAFGPNSFGKRWGWELPYEVQCGIIPN